MIGAICYKKLGGDQMPSDPYYYSKKHRAWRAAVLRKAGYLCEECMRFGIRTAASHAHHIKPRAEYPALQYVVSNGKALCGEHHNKLEPRTTNRGKQYPPRY